MTIEWFNPRAKLPLVSIHQYGLVFNQAAVALLSRPTYVMLGFDAEKNLIVVKPIHDVSTMSPDTAISFAARERNGSVRLATREFIRFVLSRKPELSSMVGARYSAYWDDKEKVLVVDLNKQEQKASRRKQKSN